MPIYTSKRFAESQLAHQLLDGLCGLEIGGAAHNAFGLDTLNVDRFAIGSDGHKPYADEQMRLCGHVMPVDIVAPGDKIPVKDQSFDFVISSHVIEHFYDPISAIKEWMRIATRYIFIIAPQRDALESDRDKPLTPLEEHIERFTNRHIVKCVLVKKGVDGEPDEYVTRKFDTDEHHSRWTCESFCDMVDWICRQEWGEGWEICATEDPDKKVGNGFTVVMKRMYIKGAPGPELRGDYKKNNLNP